MLAERNSLRSIARIKQAKLDTVLHGWTLLANKSLLLAAGLFGTCILTQVQIDELWTFVKKSRATSKRMKPWAV